MPEEKRARKDGPVTRIRALTKADSAPVRLADARPRASGVRGVRIRWTRFASGNRHSRRLPRTGRLPAEDRGKARSRSSPKNTFSRRLPRWNYGDGVDDARRHPRAKMVVVINPSREAVHGQVCHWTVVSHACWARSGEERFPSPRRRREGRGRNALRGPPGRDRVVAPQGAQHADLKRHRRRLRRWRDRGPRLRAALGRSSARSTCLTRRRRQAEESGELAPAGGEGAHVLDRGCDRRGGGPGRRRERRSAVGGLVGLDRRRKLLVDRGDRLVDLFIWPTSGPSAARTQSGTTISPSSS